MSRGLHSRRPGFIALGVGDGDRETREDEEDTSDDIFNRRRRRSTLFALSLGEREERPGRWDRRRSVGPSPERRL
jgi:hypothetical protein